MKSASQFQSLLQQYRTLCQEIEWLKPRIVGISTFPVDKRRWKLWKERQARTKRMSTGDEAIPELSDDPHYQHLLRLKDQLLDVWCEMQGDADDCEAEQALIYDVATSFPSLRAVIKHECELEMVVSAMLCRDQSCDPQAFHAALFVQTLQSIGRCRHSSDAKFFIDRAFEVWDDQHREAFARWMATPCFPSSEFRRLSVEPPTV
jgi:hypothetical protein